MFFSVQYNMAYFKLNSFLVIFLYILEIFAQDLSNVIAHYERYNIMKVLEGGKFLKGINDPKSETGEYPVEVAEVKPFYIDVYPVTIAQYWNFIQSKPKYKTDAEIAGWSWVLRNFVDPKNINNNSTDDQAWIPVNGARWNQPEGPNSKIRDRLDYPVVHISYSDAKAFCEHYHKRLPLEVEWEFAARGGFYGQSYPWGDRYQKNRANLWQGKFPDGNTKIDKWEGLSPVHAFPAQNEYGLFDMQGNVWEWTSSIYYERVVPRHLQDKMYVLKGCSFVDTRDGKANSLVRVSQRMGLVPTYTSYNIGFRCAKSAKHYWKKPAQPPKKDLPKERPSGPRQHLRSEMVDPDLAEKIRKDIKKPAKKRRRDEL